MQYVCLIAAFVVFGGVNGQLAGGLSDVNASEYTSSAWKSVPEINGKNNGPTYLVPIKVVKAQVQVVAGTNTVLQVLVGESTCAKGGSGSIEAKKVTAANCPVKADGKRSLYKVSIWEKSWENFEQITAEKIRDVKPSENF